ncbi:EAL domain-containing protein [Sphingosinicella rhizophila]|uniref:EAL domain-containing protein n=1 Tax=Sphingosinicella rhizophila TaxID=3050082 RepID=A0ABU3QBP0_9SPHN|nr:EAL domain-containing protein [Sphingosinicella sp. GR2756]MDT9600692.1 EAL domain-containing protein [Sphingosinicella sp. GR2756]
MNLKLAQGFEERPMDALGSAEIAFQPIVDSISLRCHGFEALTRLKPDSLYSDICHVMDAASATGELARTERMLLTKSISRFAEIDGAGATRLFCNVDNRVFDDPDIKPGNIVELAVQKGLTPANLCIELSERQPPKSIDALRRIVDMFLRFNVRIAIDDFGRGFSGMDMLLQVNPHYIKIDQAFIRSLNTDARKQAIVHKVTGLSHSLGLLVVAEGVETEAELRNVRELGCDLVQGFLIARPTVDLGRVRMNYEGKVASRPARGISPIILDLMEEVQPVSIGAPLSDVIDRFKVRDVRSFLPVVDDHGYLHGAVYEADVASYLFGDYGPSLLANKGMNQSVGQVIRRCPISEAHVGPETLVESYVVSAGNEGLALTAEGRYVGFLSNNAILRLAAAREVEAARQQNPLTQLPGNISIGEHVDAIISGRQTALLAFFDFDNFKAFNDKYGFAVGDRALLLFSDLLKSFSHDHDAFIGHIGGDDFFLSIDRPDDSHERQIETLCRRFEADAANLYSPEDRVAGGIVADDRFGEKRFFPLLRTSAILLHVSRSAAYASSSDIFRELALGKSLAKKSPNGIHRMNGRFL